MTSCPAITADTKAPTGQVLIGEIIVGPATSLVGPKPTEPRPQGLRRVTTGLRHIITGPPGRHRRH